MNLNSFFPQLQRRFFRVALLLAFLLFLGSTTSAQTQTPQASWKKIRSAAPPLYSKRMEIGVTTPTIIQIREDKPSLKEIDAEASIALRIVGTGEDAITRPFWFGQADFSSSATKRQGNWSRINIYDPQKYLWTVAPEPTIPVAQPAELHPALKLVEVGASLGILPVDPLTKAKIEWDNLRPSLKTTLKLVGQEVVGLEETAVDGRPLGQLKPNISRPDKHFYWNFGESQDEFPQTTSAQVVFTSDNAPDAIGPAKAIINWHLPTRTVYDVEVGLWNWTSSEDADAATLDEWVEQLLTDPEVLTQFALDVGIEVVGIIPIGRVAGAGGKVAFRVILKNKASARVVSRVIESGFLKSTKRAILRADGSLVPAPVWHKTHKIQTVVKDSVRRRESAVVTVLKKEGEDAAGEAAKDIIEESLDDDDVPEEEKKERDSKTEIFIDDSDGELYLYSGSSSYQTNYWNDPNGSGRWDRGFYLTDMPPNAAQALLSGKNPNQVASALRAGQHSFALYGHPYVGTVYWTKVKIGAITSVTTINGVEQPPQPVEPALRQVNQYELKSKGDGMPYKDWNYNVFVYTSPSGATLHPKRITGVSHGTVSFQGGTPGAADVPNGTLFPVSDGFWTDTANKENSVWNSTKVDVIELDERLNGTRRNPMPIEFNDGYPNFGPWIIKDKNGNRITAPLPLQHGDQDNSGNDFKRADAELASILLQTDPDVAQTFYNATTGELVISRVQNWRANYKVNGVKTSLTWHHNPDMKTMELVPGLGLNNSVPHAGGGTWARSARW